MNLNPFQWFRDDDVDDTAALFVEDLLADSAESTAPVAHLATDLPGTEEAERRTPVIEVMAGTATLVPDTHVRTGQGPPVAERSHGCRTFGCPARFKLPYAAQSVTALDTLMRNAGWTLGSTGWVCNAHTPLRAITAPATEGEPCAT